MYVSWVGGGRHNGDEMYSYDDDNKHWPESPKKFYGNFFLQQTAGGVLFFVVYCVCRGRRYEVVSVRLVVM